jgi:hypothetical protein
MLGMWSTASAGQTLATVDNHSFLYEAPARCAYPRGTKLRALGSSRGSLPRSERRGATGVSLIEETAPS